MLGPDVQVLAGLSQPGPDDTLVIRIAWPLHKIAPTP